MGYACPVCDAPQADGEHLANHVAFTAMLHGGAHADFLDARVEGWQEKKPPELAAELIHHADRTEYDAVFEDTTEGPGMGHGGEGDTEGPGMGHVGEGGPDEGADAGWSAQPPGDAPDLDALDDDTLDEETERAIEEARKLFRRGDDAEE